MHEEAQKQRRVRLEKIQRVVTKYRKLGYAIYKRLNIKKTQRRVSEGKE